MTAPRGRGAQLAAGVAAARRRVAAAAARRYAPANRAGGRRRPRPRPGRLFPFRSRQRRSARAAAGTAVAWRCRAAGAALWRPGAADPSRPAGRGGRHPPAAADGGRRSGPPPRPPAPGGAGRGRDDLGGEVAAPGLVPPLAAQSGVPGTVFRRRATAADRAAVRMRDTVVVFARAPRLGAVKRRLARDIGDRAALRFHRRDDDQAAARTGRRPAVPHRAGGHAGPCAVSPAGPGGARCRKAAAISACAWTARSGGSRVAAWRSSAATSPTPGRATRARRSVRWAARTRRSVRRRTAATGWWRCRRADRRVRSRRCAGPPSTRWRTRWPTSAAGGSRCCARCTMWIPPRTGRAHHAGKRWR